MSIAPPPTVVDAAALADELVRFRIVGAERLSELLAAFTGGGPAGLAEFLVNRQAITPFQAARALAGETNFLAPGPYRLTAVLRTGTLGPVFRATHVSKPGTFAVKLLPLRSLWQARQAKQLTRTYSRFAAHPGVVPLIDADTANGFHYLVWPATDDRPFAERLDGADLMPPVEVATILARLAEALGDCHARNLPHGAITPHAVGIAPDGAARLLDFGVGALLAQNLAAAESLFDSFTLSQAVVEMLDFSAPELLADPTQLTPAADLYSLGAVGFVALTGKRPAGEPSLTLRLLARQIGDKPIVREVNPDVPRELAQVVDRLLAANPAERYADAAEVRELLTAAVERMDPLRPVLLAPGAASLCDQHRARTVDPGHALNAAPASRGSGSAAWGVPGSGVARAAERDASDASITFDLPPEPAPDALIRPLESVDTPRSSLNETRPESTPLSRDHKSRSRISPSPAQSASPAQTDGPNMAKTKAPDPFDPAAHPLPKDPPLTKRPATPPPDMTPLPTPVQWHTGGDPDPDAPAPEANAAPAHANSVLWKKVKRNLLFWQAPTDPVVVSVYGPVTAVPGTTVRVTAFLHHPDSTDSVQTLSRAFEHDAELLGTGNLAREVAREATVGVHLSIMNAAATRSLMEVVWRGQPLRLSFDLHVPWESPPGAAPGLVSVGLANVRIGKAAFTLNILPRRG